MDLLTTTDWVLLLLSILALGCTAGFLAGLLGIGGGIILVPGLYYIFTALGLSSDSLMQVCIGTSLAIIVPTGLSSARSHYKRGAVDIDLVKAMGAGIVIGSIIGSIIADMLSSMTLKYIFATAFVILSIIMMANTRGKTFFPSMPGKPVTMGISTVIGTISSLIGIGGATLNVPFMSVCNVPIHKAIGTASALGLFISVPATLGFILTGWNETGLPPFSLGYVNLPAFLIIIPASVLVAKLGVHVAHIAPVKLMRQVFAFFMVIVAIKLWSDLLL